MAKKSTYNIKLLKYIVITLSAIAIIFYLLLLTMRLDVMQRRLASFVASSIVEEYQIPINIKRLEIRNLDELLLKNVSILDDKGDTIINAAEATAHISPFDLFDNKLTINTLTFAAPDIRLSRPTPQEPLNIQFIIDNITKNQSKEKKQGFSLSINQFIVYDGRFKYDIESYELLSDRFDPGHIEISGFGCNVSLKKFNTDTLSIYIRSIRGCEKSGLELAGFRARVNASPEIIRLSNLGIKLPNSNLQSDSITVYIGGDSLTPPAIRGELRSDCFDIQDLAPLHQKLRNDIPRLSFGIQGEIDIDTANIDIDIYETDYDSKIKADIALSAPYSSERVIDFRIHDIYLREATTGLIATLANVGEKASKIISGNFRMTGDGHLSPKGISCNLFASNALGEVKTQARIDSTGLYNIFLQGNNIQLRELTGVSGLKQCNVAATANGNINSNGRIAEFHSEISGLQFKGYEYTDINITGEAFRDQVNLTANTADPNIEAGIDFEYATCKDARVKLTVETFNPSALHLIDDKTDNTYSFTLNGTYSQRDATTRNVTANIDRLTISNNDEECTIRNIYIIENSNGKEKIFAINSDFIKGSIIGEYELQSLPNSFSRAISQHLPSLKPKSNSRNNSRNDFYYNIDIDQTDILARMYNLPIAINEDFRISGICNDRQELFTLQADINNINISGGIYRKINIESTSNKNGFSLSATVDKPIIKNRKTFNYNDLNNDIRIELQTGINNDTIRNTIHWDNYATKQRILGTLRLDASINELQNGNIDINARIHDDIIVHNDSIWNISQGTISGNLDRLAVENISLYNTSQYLKIDGWAGTTSEDTLNIRTNDLEISTILDLVNFRILKINGCATGNAYATSLLSAPDIMGKFDVDSISLDDAYLGSCEATVGWSNETKSVLLNCDITNGQYLSTVGGFLSQANDTIELKIAANNLNAAFIGKKVGAFLDNVSGKTSGLVFLRGSWRHVDLYGATALNCSARVKATNVTYTFIGDTLRFTEGALTFENARVRDKDGNMGILSESVNHRKLSHWTCNLNIAANNLLVYDTPDFGSLPFYGTVYGTGNARLSSDGKGISLSAELRNAPNSKFIYNSSDIGGVRDNSFVTFVDNSKVEERPTATADSNNKYNDVSSKLNLDFLLDINDSFKLRVYTNTRTDDYIDVYGNGPIHAIYDDKAGFSMKGNLNLDRGTYKFTIQDIFPKEFSISRNSTIHFTGDPFNASLNLNTKHLIPSVSLSDLTTSSSMRKTVKVNCLMNITGTLKAPALNFDLELPEGSEEERELLSSIASTPEQKNMQFIYLLGIGKFYTLDNSTNTNSNQTSTAVESLISNTLSNQLNNMLGQIIDNGNWDISGNFSTSERGWNSMEVEGMLEGRLLNDRLLINGNLGYRENPVANRNFIGDFEVQWLLNQQGTLSLKAYSKTNDRYFSKTNLTTQGAGFLYRIDFDNWRWWRKRKNTVTEEEEEEENITTEKQ